MTPEKLPLSPRLATAIRRLSEWNEGEANNMLRGYGPNSIPFRDDLRLILTEYREIVAESARIVRNYEELNSIIQKLGKVT
jgi:hypothetical protein